MAVSRLRVPGAIRSVGARFRGVLHLDDPPWRLALSLAVGVFISFTPFYGLQTVLAIGAAVALRLNRAATVAGTWLNLPWFAPVVYAGLSPGTLVPDPAASVGPGWRTPVQPGVSRRDRRWCWTT
jgi:hypothetical protein